MDVSLDSYGVLQVEPTDLCNLRCAMCTPQLHGAGRVHGVQGGTMDPALFRSIFDDLEASDCHFDHVILQWMGDPSLHPQLPGLVGHAARRLQGRASYLRVDTNGITLDPPRMDALVNAWLPWSQLPLLLVFSLDACSRDTYARVKGRDQLQRVQRNIRHLVDRRAALAQPQLPLNIQLQFVLQQQNAHEVGSFVRSWQHFLACRRAGPGGPRGHDEIMIKRLSVAAGGPGPAAAARRYDRSVREQGVRASSGPPCAVVLWEDRPWERDDEIHEGPRGPCPGAWMTPTVRHDGQLTVCCVDLRGQLALGSLAERGFTALWEGERATALRLAHLRGELSAWPTCAACGGINWYGFPPATVKAWLQARGRSELWPVYAQRMGLER